MLIEVRRVMNENFSEGRKYKYQTKSIALRNTTEELDPIKEFQKNTRLSNKKRKLKVIGKHSNRRSKAKSEKYEHSLRDSWAPSSVTI